jgi:hypothetical protein
MLALWLLMLRLMALGKLMLRSLAMVQMMRVVTHRRRPLRLRQRMRRFLLWDVLLVDGETVRILVDIWEFRIRI